MKERAPAVANLLSPCARGGIHEFQRETEFSEVPVVQGIEGRDLVIQGRVRQVKVVHLGPAQPAKSLQRGQCVREGVGFRRDQGKDGQVFPDLRDDLSMGDAEPCKHREKLPHGLLGDARAKRPRSGAGPEGKTQVGVVQGRCGGAKKDPGVKQDDPVHGRFRS